MAKSTQSKSASALQILVVDDNDEFVHLFAKFLNDEGHYVGTAFDGPTALDAIRIRRELGLDKTTLIAVTGFGGRIDKRRAKDAGFDGHLLKPTDFQLVREILKGIIKERSA